MLHLYSWQCSFKIFYAEWNSKSGVSFTLKGELWVGSWPMLHHRSSIYFYTFLNLFVSTQPASLCTLTQSTINSSLMCCYVSQKVGIWQAWQKVRSLPSHASDRPMILRSGLSGSNSKRICFSRIGVYSQVSNLNIHASFISNSSNQYLLRTY